MPLTANGTTSANGASTSLLNGQTNGTSVQDAPVISTLPAADFSWKVSLENKVIAITGANRGIGLGLAEVCLANSAAQIFSLDFMEPGEEFFALQKKNSGKLHFIQTDVTKEESVENAVNTVVEQAGTIHGMIANAGMTRHQPALQFDRAQIEQLFNLNVYGAFFCAQIAARKFIELGVKGAVSSCLVYFVEDRSPDNLCDYRLYLQPL